MTDRAPDLGFPECCVYCPHLRPVQASCTHAFRQSLVREVATDRTCPVYSAVKTRAMRELSGSL